MGRFKNEALSDDQRRPHQSGLSDPNGFKIVLFEPRIPQNTGAIARMCAATGCSLELVAPFFKIDDAKLKRAGLDYWHLLDVRFFESVEEWLEKNKETRSWFVELGSTKSYTEANFQAKDALVFGDEQGGIREDVLERFKDHHISIPQKNVRSMNLSNCASIVTFEALRQCDFPKMNFGPRTS
jgi:tRNA (cytidine/uridine-2'-O-)-methyltransferase